MDRRRRLGALWFVPPLTLALGCTAKIDDPTTSPGPQGSGASGAMGGSGAVGQGGSTAATGGTSSGGTGGSSASGGTGTGGTATGGAGGGIGATGGTGPGGSGGVPPSGINLRGSPVYHRVVRLTPAQWEASVRDLLKLPDLPGLASSFAPDPPNGMFTNNERALFVNSDLRTDFQRGAETLAAQVAGDAAALARVTGGGNDKAAFVRTFGRRVFRRPLTTAEETTYQATFDSGATYYATGNAFTDGVRIVIEQMLQSPNFLYRLELGTNGAPLTGYEMASKLSFLLRDT